MVCAPFIPTRLWVYSTFADREFLGVGPVTARGKCMLGYTMRTAARLFIAMLLREFGKVGRYLL